MDAEQRAIAKSQRTLDDLPAPARTIGYRVIQKESAGDLEAYVVSYLSQGWELEGGVCVSYAPGGTWYAQAMSLRSASEA